MLNKQEDLQRQTWSILQAICNDEEEGLMNQLKEEGQITDIDELEQILVMCEFTLIADLFTNYIYSMREALRENLLVGMKNWLPRKEIKY